MDYNSIFFLFWMEKKIKTAFMYVVIYRKELVGGRGEGDDTVVERGT